MAEMIGLIRIIVSAASFLALTSAGLAQAAQSDDENFLQFADDVGFGNPPGDLNKYVLKWTTPMAVDTYFSAKTPPEIVTSISSAFDEAQRASGLPMRFYRNIYNVMVLTADWKAGGLNNSIDTISKFFDTRGAAQEFVSRRESSTKKCATQFIVRDDVIQAALILVDVGGDDLRLIEHCIVRTVAGLFGLGTLSIADDKPYPSIANGKLNAVSLTEYDKRFLRLLYDPAIRSGMTEAAALPIFRSLVRASVGR
jgi:hypothetical protein